ncbi:hypothetical protein Tco_0728598 [Tanacetum coccineum]|uniref:Uncharacterized protein n=1 Tax=Tanacetum coccineum TaxID=301880 RepID=A0ABQ4YP93_9ASTR
MRPFGVLHIGIKEPQSIWRVVRHRISGGRWTTRYARGSYAYVVVAFQAPPSPDYVSGPEYPPLPDFVPELVYLEFMPPEDEVLPAKEQPLPTAVLPTADSPGYVHESDPEEDPEDDDVEDPKEDPANYPANGGDDGVIVAEETEPFETDESAATPPPHPTYRVTARISIRDELPTPFCITRKRWRCCGFGVWLDIPSPPASPIHLLGYRAAMIRLRAEAPSTSHSLLLPPPIILSHTRSDAPSSGTPPLLPIPLPTSSPPLHLLFTDRRADKPEVTLPPRKRLGIPLGPRYEVGESSSAAAARPPGGFRAEYGFVATMDKEIMRDLERDVGYGITNTWDEMLVDMPGAPATDDTKLGRRYKFTTGDRHAHARTTRLMEAKARITADSDYQLQAAGPTGRQAQKAH